MDSYYRCRDLLFHGDRYIQASEPFPDANSGEGRRSRSCGMVTDTREQKMQGSLVALDASGNRMDDDCVEPLLVLRSLEKLYLADNEIADLALVRSCLGSTLDTTGKFSWHALALAIERGS